MLTPRFLRKSYQGGTLPNLSAIFAITEDESNDKVTPPAVAKPNNSTMPSPGSGFNIGFQVSEDGFGFRNYGKHFPDSQLTPLEVQELFGARICASGQGANCTPYPETQLWIDTMNDYMASGHCAGFTVASARFFNKQLELGRFTAGAELTFQIQQNPPAMRQIAKDWTLQVTDEVLAQQVNGTPRQIVEALLALKQPVDLGVFSRSGGGHSLLAYGVVDKGNGIYHIMVYDNNWPG